MEKDLLIKILGKENSVKLEDQIYMLREITDEIRMNLFSNIDVFCDEVYIKRLQIEINQIEKELQLVLKEVNNPENAIGYTNSKIYLKKYIMGIFNNLNLLRNNLKPYDIQKITYYNNMLADLVLKY